MEIRQLEGAIEAILFTMGEAVELCQIAKAIQQDKATTEKLIHNLMDKYQDEGRGIHIIELENSYQLCTKRDYYGCLIRIAMQPQKPALTDVMLETLSIIAYKQPVTKAEIEKIRGVKSDHAVNKLVEYNLVKELGASFCGPGENGRLQGGGRRRDTAEAGRIKGCQRYKLSDAGWNI